MTLMKIRDMQKGFGERMVLKNINFDIKKNARIGLVGDNGAGKSTLANIISGKLEYDKGFIERGNVEIGYLLQSTEYTLNDYLDVFNDEAEDVVFKSTRELGLNKANKWSESQRKNLSGGEKLKISLSKICTSKPDLLILDEPTNHLDFQGIEWLVDFLKSYHGAVLIISHDRSFLDHTVQEIVEIEEGVSKKYTGNYSAYRSEKERKHAEQVHQYKLQQKNKERIQAQITSLQQWSKKAHNQSTKREGKKEYFRVKAKKMDIQIKSKKKRLEKELKKNKIDKPKEASNIHFHYDQSDNRHGKRVIEASKLEKSFDGQLLFKESDFYLKYGERIAIVGANGCGKTTLVKMIIGSESLSKGELWKSDSLNIGYLSQDVLDLDPQKTVLEILQISERDELSRVRTILANLELNEEKLELPIEQLSLGERTRVKLVMILLNEVDLLLMDEPTNHLDLASRESLERLLLNFKGTMLIVSHDSYFIEKMCESLLVFEDNEIKRKEMRLSEYRSKKNVQGVMKEIDAELKVLENQISYLLGRISLYSKSDERYLQTDMELTDLLKRKNDLLKLK